MGEEILENWRRWRCEDVIILGDGESGMNENMVSLSTENTTEVCDYKCKVSSESTGCVCLCVCMCFSSFIQYKHMCQNRQS